MAALAAVVSTRRRKRAETTFEWRLARSVSARTACLARRLPISSTNQFWPDDREAPGYFDDIGWGFGMLVRIRGPYLGPSPGVSYPWAVSPTRPSTTDYAGVYPSRPQAEIAASATTRSLRNWSCWESLFPPLATDAKPHCGLTARLSMSTYCAASSIRATTSSTSSSCGVFVLTRPRTTTFPWGT